MLTSAMALEVLFLCSYQPLSDIIYQKRIPYNRPSSSSKERAFDIV